MNAESEMNALEEGDLQGLATRLASAYPIFARKGWKNEELNCKLLDTLDCGLRATMNLVNFLVSRQ